MEKARWAFAEPATKVSISPSWADVFDKFHDAAYSTRSDGRGVLGWRAQVDASLEKWVGIRNQGR